MISEFVQFTAMAWRTTALPSSESRWTTAKRTMQLQLWHSAARSMTRTASRTSCPACRLSQEIMRQARCTRDLKRVTVDTTVQPKAITLPTTGAKLLHAAIKGLNRSGFSGFYRRNCRLVSRTPC